MRHVFTIGGVEFDTQLTIVIILGTILPMLDWYRHTPVGYLQDLLGVDWGFSLLEQKAWDRMIYYFLIPMLTLFLFRENPINFGFQFGKWPEGLMWTIVACAGMTVILWFVARSESMSSYYSVRTQANVLREIYVTGLDLFSWEFIWRGFMLFAMAKVIGVGPAIWLQAVPFAFMHLNKPEIETLTTIFGGAAFGFIAWRTNSFVYPFLIHWYIASFTKLITMGVF
ncbi:MAG: CPBP family intramembrane glutamic endopeptidase [Chloroflexota bacterium]